MERNALPDWLPSRHSDTCHSDDSHLFPAKLLDYPIDRPDHSQDTRQNPKKLVLSVNGACQTLPFRDWDAPDIVVRLCASRKKH